MRMCLYKYIKINLVLKIISAEDDRCTANAMYDTRAALNPSTSHWIGDPAVTLRIAANGLIIYELKAVDKSGTS